MIGNGSVSKYDKKIIAYLREVGGSESAELAHLQGPHFPFPTSATVLMGLFRGLIERKLSVQRKMDTNTFI